MSELSDIVTPVEGGNVTPPWRGNIAHGALCDRLLFVTLITMVICAITGVYVYRDAWRIKQIVHFTANTYTRQVSIPTSWQILAAVALIMGTFGVVAIHVFLWHYVLSGVPTRKIVFDAAATATLGIVGVSFLFGLLMWPQPKVPSPIQWAETAFNVSLHLPAAATNDNFYVLDGVGNRWTVKTTWREGIYTVRFGDKRLLTP